MTTQTVQLVTFDYGPSLSSVTLRSLSNDSIVATADTCNELSADSGVYAAVFGETSVIPAGTYRLRAVVSGAPINRYVTLAGVDGEVVQSSGSPEQSTLLQVQSTVTAISAALAGTPIQPNSRIASGGTITAYIGDDFKVRSGTQLQLSVSDVGGALNTKWSAIGAANLYFGASREGAEPGSVNGTVASIASVGSGASQTCRLTIEITNCGSGLKPGTYEYQIEQRRTQGSEVDSFIEVAGSLILKRNSVA